MNKGRTEHRSSKNKNKNKKKQVELFCLNNQRGKEVKSFGCYNTKINFKFQFVGEAALDL